MCEPRDIGRTLGSDDAAFDAAFDGVESRSAAAGDADNALDGSEMLTDEQFRPTLFLFDALPGGVGLARRIYERTEELMARAAFLISSCPCTSGCPACIGAAMVRSERKAAAIALLEGSLRSFSPPGMQTHHK